MDPGPLTDKHAELDLSCIMATAGSPTARDKAVLWSVVAMLGYFVVDNHVDLYPWNDLDRVGSQLASTLSGVIPFTLAALAFRLGWRWAMVFFAGYAWVWLGIQVWNWWVPYLFGGERSFLPEYERTLHPLPPINGRPGPNAEHLVLQLLSLVMALSMTMANVRAFRPGAGRGGSRSTDC